jgi:glycine/D-amino acid oxidase-like deaminating enzyme
MELTSDYPFWSIRNGLPADYPSLDRDVKCEVVVIGGGITGALVAFHLVDAGINTVLLDKREIGTGSTSASTGLLQYEVDVPLRTLVKRLGHATAARSYQLCDEAIDKLNHLVGKLKIDCDFELKPSLFLARETSEIDELKEEYRLRREIGLDLDFWSQSDIERHFPFSRPAALFSQHAAEVDPHRLTHGLLTAAARRGLQVFDRTDAVRFRSQANGIVVTTREGFTVKARCAVMAAGFESMAYVRGEAGTLKSTYALISEPIKPLKGWYRRSLIWESGLPYLYLRTTGDHRVIVGGEDVDLVKPSARDALIRRKGSILLRKFHALFPEIQLKLAYVWAGTFGETKDGLAYIGENRGLPHTFFALGYGGNGITYSIIAAEIIRDKLLGRPNADAKIFRFGR